MGWGGRRERERERERDGKVEIIDRLIKRTERATSLEMAQ